VLTPAAVLERFFDVAHAATPPSFRMSIEGEFETPRGNGTYDMVGARSGEDWVVKPRNESTTDGGGAGLAFIDGSFYAQAPGGEWRSVEGDEASASAFAMNSFTFTNALILEELGKTDDSDHAYTLRMSGAWGLFPPDLAGPSGEAVPVDTTTLVVDERGTPQIVTFERALDGVGTADVRFELSDVGGSVDLAPLLEGTGIPDPGVPESSPDASLPVMEAIALPSGVGAQFPGQPTLSEETVENDSLGELQLTGASLSVDGGIYYLISIALSSDYLAKSGAEAVTREVARLEAPRLEGGRIVGQIGAQMNGVHGLETISASTQHVYRYRVYVTDGLATIIGFAGSPAAAASGAIDRFLRSVDLPE
jgi:hypothetical protein